MVLHPRSQTPWQRVYPLSPVTEVRRVHTRVLSVAAAVAAAAVAVDIVAVLFCYVGVGWVVGLLLVGGHVMILRVQLVPKYT